jgi:chromate transporter
VGLVGGRYRPELVQVGGHHASQGERSGRAVIDDDTPVPTHAVFTWARVARVSAACATLWAVVLGALTWRYGWDAVLTQMGWFFTKAALVTFGGAYAVLPYVVQGGVVAHHWLTATQMIDGLALGETTPGPLIMVVAFVGFVGGWTKAVFGPDAALLAGVAAAAVATFFTFLPSFFFILVGGPFIESTHGKLGFTAPLTGITAAVVGVIVNLAVFFAWHVFWPRGIGGPVEWPALVIGIGAAVALFRFKAGVIPVVFAAGLAGLLLSLLRS